MRAMLPLLLLVIAFPAAAKNPYEQFYNDTVGGAELPRANPAGKPALYSGGPNKEQDAHSMMQRGFALIGYSAFNAGSGIDDKKAEKQAERVGADVVLLYSNYSGSQSYSAPIFLPNNTVSTSTTTGTVYGPYGQTAQYQGRTNTTTSGGLSVIPRTVTVSRSDYVATYWVMMKPLPFGAKAVDLTPEERKALGRNRGATIAVVINGSPAFEADILEGDTVLGVNGAEISDTKDLTARMRALAGQDVTLRLWRNGSELERVVHLRP